MKLVIADSNIEYSTRLSSLIAQGNNNKFIIKIFSKQEMLVKHLKNEEADILLIDINFQAQNMCFDNVRLTIYLVDQDPIHNIEQPQNRDYIVKYQRVSNIVKQVYSYYSDVNPTNLKISKFSLQGKIISVFSPSGGSGKSTIATVLAKKYAQLGKRVFYLNFESISSSSIYFESNNRKGISEVFKSLTQGSEVRLKIEALKSKDSKTGIYYLNDPDNLLDINVVTTENIVTLIQTLTLNNICDYLVIDMSSHIDEKNIKILELANEVVIINDLSLTTIAKWSKFELAGFIYEKYKNKMRVVYNKINEYCQIKTNSLPIMAEVPLLRTSNPQELTNYIADNIAFKFID